ncbi:putative nucleotidyltransferase [Desulfuromonas soudanensis]|uniref:tRNA(Met) cytidine acetate ligase n=1 Tax=Desulfuromonas soudanensis TaxID=1603606 RepID=A0A0M3QG60_9BACT|nr:nucleotidyltransferase [Desulfuromonas soudanensis]ALC17243.1 putative nucleotidyltransferase [Desulfuromonas soudanensis]
MRAVGLITEYNPFHNGHLHHLRESLSVTGAEVSVAIMSGHFLQRGEPALLDKWLRAQMALAAGVDVVIELPFPWACNSAPHFARGAVQALTALGGIDALCFGSEAGEIDPLRRCADLLATEGKTVAAETAALLRQGINYPAARARSVAGVDSAAAALLETPNNILGLEYLRALTGTDSPIVPFTIARTGAGYHDEEACGEIASATGIRRMLGEGRGVEPYLPPAVHEIFVGAMASGMSLDFDHLHRLLLGRILRGPEFLAGLYQIEDGLAERLFAAALESSSYDDLVDSIKSRHLTRTRIQRILAYALNETRRDEMDALLEAGPLYLHLLGSSEKGRAFLGSCRKTLTLPLVQNYSRIQPLLKRRYGVATPSLRLARQMLESELRATRVYTLLMKDFAAGNRNRDFFREIRIPFD